MDYEKYFNQVESNEGINMSDLSKIAMEIGVNALPLEVSLETLIQVNKPSIVYFLHKNHFYFLFELNSVNVQIFDPAETIFNLLLIDFGKLWCSNGQKGKAIIFL